MSSKSEISKHVDPTTTVENSDNGHGSGTENQEGSKKPGYEKEVSEGNTASIGQPSDKDQPSKQEQPSSKESPSGQVAADESPASTPDNDGSPSDRNESSEDRAESSAEDAPDKTVHNQTSEPAEDQTQENPPENPSDSGNGNDKPDAPGDQTPEPDKPVEKQPQKPWDGIKIKELDKKELVRLIELLVKEDDPIQSEKVTRKLKARYDKIHQQERQEAHDQFVADGNDADHFAYKFDELDNRFDGAFKLIRDRKSQFVKDLERNKEKNLAEKESLLEALRKLVDEEETVSSIESVRRIQEKWKALGQVPGQHVKSLWANYHALMDLYYDQRSIYFELKELDRRKNLEAKLEVCEKAEKLVSRKNLKQAINELNELHEEFKHIGPVPETEQQGVWERLKAASDQIYARRKEFIRHLKKDLKENLKKKSQLAEEVQEFQEFTSKRITDWNKKTREILELQKKWEDIGGLPREQAKEVNKKFWGAFKGFFQNKGSFFKELEGQRETNLEKKRELVAAAENLKDSTDWHQTAEKLKTMQKEWKNIGPVPEKHRSAIYGKFKEACDTFFNNRRAQSQEIEKDFIENLKQKQKICVEIESMTTAGDYNLDRFLDLKQKYNELGYVPAAEVKNIRSHFLSATDDFLASVPDELAEEARQIKYDIQFEKLKKGPNANRKIEQREQTLRKDIGTLENDIATWKNNLEFFASSKEADKFKQEFTTKIEQATKKLKELKSQLRAVREL